MCGISGCINLHRGGVSLEKIKLMTDTLSHRGPDGEGQWMNGAQTVGLGHRRLAIVDLSDTGAQPMHYLSRYTIVFNGEIYNYPELKKMLSSKGYAFKTNSDTEVLMALYDFKKDKCFDDIDGMFAFAIWDEQEQELFCARDRFGEKPFFYYQTSEAFYFGSEIKALWAAGAPKIPNKQRIFLYLAYGAQEDSNNKASTFYNDIYQLEPAHFLVIRQNKIHRKIRYWNIDPNHRNNEISLENARTEFYDLLKGSVERRLRADVTVGSSLSGGLDSTSIVALINRLKNSRQEQKTFSARFPGYSKDEGKYIELVAKKFDIQSYQVFLDSELLQQRFEKVFFHQEEPFGSTSVLAQWEVMNLARDNNIKVLLDGQGADELLGGYLKFFNNYLSSLLIKSWTKYFTEAKKYSDFYNSAPSFTKLLIEGYFPNLRNRVRKFKNNIVAPEYLKQFDPDFLSAFSVKFEHAFSPDLNYALYNETLNGPLSNLLRYADRNSMGNSVEVRLPFLDHSLVKFVFSLPDEYKLNGGWTKFILRESMKDIIPIEIYERKDKVGFEPPSYNQSNESMAAKAYAVLTSEKIIKKNKALPRINWEYCQVAQLFSK